MTLSALIKKGGLTARMTATVATPATQQTDGPIAVAPVATVAVTELSAPLPVLSPDQESDIRAWLAHIGEIDQENIAEVLGRCQADLKARRYFLERTKEVPKPITLNQPVTCRGCIQFERIDHPHLGHCAKGEPEAVAGLCDTDRRYCESYLPGPQQTKSDQSRPARSGA